MIESRCGILCSACKYKEQMNCKGCIAIDKPFWGDCDVKSCCEAKKYDYCGQCPDFPCSTLTEMSYAEEEGDNGKRIETCRIWASQEKPTWQNILLTDSGLYYDNELDKPLTLLISRFRAMLGKPFSEAKVLFIPTAAMQDKVKADAITKRLQSELLCMGILPGNITIHDIDGSLTEDDAMKFDVIYFTGGNTPYLAKRVKEANFDKIIKKMIYANKVYVGMSAGSMLLMSHFNVDDIHNSNFEGLGLINAYGTAHCPPGTPNRTDLPLPHIALQENQALEVHNDGYTLIKAFSAEKFLSDVMAQDAAALQQYFTPDAVICWHDSNEQFTAAEYIRANCEYPGVWKCNIERINEIDGGIALVYRISSEDGEMHLVTSFIKFDGDKINRMDDYYSMCHTAPEWRQAMKIGKPII